MITSTDSLQMHFCNDSLDHFRSHKTMLSSVWFAILYLHHIYTNSINSALSIDGEVMLNVLRYQLTH